MGAIRRSFWQLIRDRRGAATAEAAVVLPVMAICWAAVYFHFRGYESKLVAARDARSEAWQISAAACANAPLATAAAFDSRSSLSPEWLRSHCGLPVVDEAFGTMTGAVTTVRVRGQVFRAPPLLGGRSYQTAYDYYIACAEQPIDSESVSRSALCANLGRFGLDIGFAVNCPPTRHPDAENSCR